MAKFEKGNNKSNGRPKGSENKEKKKIREAINKLLDDTDIGKLYNSQKTPRDKANFLLSLLEYSLPKLSRTTLEGDKDNPLYTTDLSGLTYKELKELTKKDEN